MQRILTITMMLVLAGAAFAQEKGESKEEKEALEAKQYVTEHSANIGGNKIDCTVTAGTMLMKNDEDEP